MRWIATTVALAVACLVGAAWVGLRDWERPAPGPGERARILATGRQLFCCGRLTARCPRCGVEVVEVSGPGRWRIRVTGAAAVRCFTLDLDAFAARRKGGYDGIATTSCPGRTRASPAS